MPPNLTRVFFSGDAHSIEAVVCDDGTIPALEFWNGDLALCREGAKGDPDCTAQARFAVLFRQMGNYGELPQKRFDKEMGKLSAFKHEVANRQIRFPCFRDGDKLILTHGFFKPGAKTGKGKWPKSEVKRANDLMDTYWRRKAEIESKK